MIITFTSKTHGSYDVVLDKQDYNRIKKLGGKWCVSKKRRSLIYFQKRIRDERSGSKGRIIELHRWIMGEPKGMVVDHIDGNTLNNRRSNLRICSNAANIRNGRVRSNTQSGVSGVRKREGRSKWYASIRVNYKTIPLGTYDLFEDAVRARREAERVYFDY